MSFQSIIFFYLGSGCQFVVVWEGRFFLVDGFELWYIVIWRFYVIEEILGFRDWGERFLWFVFRVEF